MDTPMMRTSIWTEEIVAILTICMADLPLMPAAMAFMLLLLSMVAAVLNCLSEQLMRISGIQTTRGEKDNEQRVRSTAMLSDHD